MTLRLTTKFFNTLCRRYSLRQHADNQVEINGITLHFDIDHVQAYLKKTLLQGKYERHERTILETTLESTDVVLELGGGIGYVSTISSLRIGSQNVFTVEANPKLIDTIKQNHSANGVSPKVYNFILGKEAGVVEFYVNENFWSSSQINRPGIVKKIQVEQRDFGEFLAHTGATYLVIDIEGGEVNLFDDVDLSQVSKILLETHPKIVTAKALSNMLVNILSAGLCLDLARSIGSNLFFYRED